MCGITALKPASRNRVHVNHQVAWRCHGAGRGCGSPRELSPHLLSFLKKAKAMLYPSLSLPHAGRGGRQQENLRNQRRTAVLRFPLLIQGSSYSYYRQTGEIKPFSMLLAPRDPSWVDEMVPTSMLYSHGDGWLLQAPDVGFGSPG